MVGAYWMIAFPVLLAIGVVTIPVVSDYADHRVAAEAAQQVGRWYWGHLMSAFAFGVAVLAAVALRTRIAATSRVWADRASLPLIVAGATLHVVGLGADGIAPVALLMGSGSPEAYFDGAGMRLSGVFIAAAAAFGVGWIGLFLEAARAELLRSSLRWLAVTGTILFVAAEAIPSGWGLYVVAAIGLVVWLSVGVTLRRASPIQRALP